MTEQLKPCPFCGSTDLNFFCDVESGTYMVRCRNCSTLFKQYHAVKDEAKEAWNRRADNDR